MSQTNLLKEILIGRQPILDLNQELIGYELLFRNGEPAETPDDACRATASVVCAAYSELGIGDARGPHKAFINVDELFLLDDALELLPADRVVLGVAGRTDRRRAAARLR